MVDRGECGAEDAYQVLRRLAAPWLMPLPLVDPHGNLDSMYVPPAQPVFTEVRLTLTDRGGSTARRAGGSGVSSGQFVGVALPERLAVLLVEVDGPDAVRGAVGSNPTDPDREVVEGVAVGSGT